MEVTNGKQDRRSREGLYRIQERNGEARNKESNNQQKPDKIIKLTNKE